MDNKLLGKFKLFGIPLLPMLSQIEVTFDIDANGILNGTVSTFYIFDAV